MKEILLSIFFAFHLTLSLKSIDFCIVKQETCIGIYDKNMTTRLIVYRKHAL